MMFCLSLNSLHPWIPKQLLVALFVFVSSESGDLLDEEGHLVLLDGARAVLVEFLEALVEVLFVELVVVVTVGHLLKSVLDELLGLLLVEGTGVVLVVGSPDIFNNLGDNGINVG